MKIKIPFHNKHSFKMGDSKRFELEDGKHTMFVLMKCWCGERQAFPSDNLQIALKEGTAKTLFLLKMLGYKNKIA